MIIKWISLIVLTAVISLMNRVAGKGGFKYAKIIRRLGIGIALCAFGLCFRVDWYYCVSVIPVYFGVATLPVTLKGSSIPAGGLINWIWVPVLGFLTALTPMPLGLPHKWLLSLMLALGFCAPMGMAAIVSNISRTAQDAKWEAVELLDGALLALLAWFTVCGSFPE